MEGFQKTKDKGWGGGFAREVPAAQHEDRVDPQHQGSWGQQCMVAMPVLVEEAEMAGGTSQPACKVCEFKA